MSDDLIKPDKTTYTLRLTRPEMKILYTALKTYYDDLGHKEDDIEEVAHAILAKLPSAEEIEAIDLKPSA